MWLSLQSARLGTGRSQVKIPPFRPFQNAAVVEHMRHPSSKRNDAGGTPAGSAILILLPGGVKVARRSVKPFVLVRVQVWQPILRVYCQQQTALFGTRRSQVQLLPP